MKTSKSTAVREAKSRQELEDLRNTRAEYGVYSEIFDRKNAEGCPECVDRYIEREIQMPSVSWTREFVNAGGSFDSCGSWGISPSKGIELEFLNIPAEFCGRMLALLGRADYDYCRVADVYKEGIDPQKRAEFHACVGGIHRREQSKIARAGKRSLMRLGWMKDEEFVRYIMKTSSRIGRNSNYFCFNGIPFYDNEKAFKNKEFLKNPMFAKWVSQRPVKEIMDLRKSAKGVIPPTGWINDVPPCLMAVALRQRKEYFRGRAFTQTSEGEVFDCGDGKTLVLRNQYDYVGETAKTIFGRQIKSNLSVAKIKNTWFIWRPENGFQKHMENADLKEGIRMWENRSQKGEPRPLCLNDVRNDVVGTAGFCLMGTKGFLQQKMPFVYRLIKEYQSWSQIPNDIMSTIWDVDFRIFNGYPIP